MDASLETLVVAAYVFATSLSIPRRPGPPGKITDQELIALAVAQAVTGIPSDRQFLGMVRRLLPGWFPHLPDQTQFNRRLRRLTPQITTVQLMLAEMIAEDRVRLVDGTLISCANYPGCAKQRVRTRCCLRLLPLQEPIRVGYAPGHHLRPQGRPRRL
jgi:hypothetical protein